MVTYFNYHNVNNLFAFVKWTEYQHCNIYLPVIILLEFAVLCKMQQNLANYVFGSVMDVTLNKTGVTVL